MSTTSKTSSPYWDKTKREFTCCQSKAAWRHKIGCPKNEGDGKLPPDKKVSLSLIGLDGNAFSLMGAFRKQARKEGWTPEEIQLVLDECMKGDYDHLLTTLQAVCENNGF